MKTCTFKGCDKPLLAKGWCWGHYSQNRKGKDLAPLRPRKKAVPITDGMKLCRECEQWKPVEDYYQNILPSGNRTILSYCKPCYNTRTKRDSARRRASANGN